MYVCSLHGLVRGENMELGRDSDTGGQVLTMFDKLISQLMTFVKQPYSSPSVNNESIKSDKRNRYGEYRHQNIDSKQYVYTFR